MHSEKTNSVEPGLLCSKMNLNGNKLESPPRGIGKEEGHAQMLKIDQIQEVRYEEGEMSEETGKYER